MTCGFSDGPPDQLRDRNTTHAGRISLTISIRDFKILGYHKSAMFNLVVETVETLIL